MILLHPFGDPQTVLVAAGSDPTQVDVTWKVGAADDLTLLGIHLGLLPQDRVMLDGAISYDAGDAEAVTGSAELREYLLDHVAVRTGSDCTGEVTRAGDLLQEGALLTFTCAGPVTEAEVQVTTLTDLHPAYRALATGPGDQHAVYEQGGDAHSWTVTAGSVTGSGPGAATTGAAAPPPTLDTGASAALQLGGVVAGLLIVVGAVALVARRRRQHPSTRPE